MHAGFESKDKKIFEFVILLDFVTPACERSNQGILAGRGCPCRNLRDAIELDARVNVRQTGPRVIMVFEERVRCQ
jgi:hypothetical protein